MLVHFWARSAVYVVKRGAVIVHRTGGWHEQQMDDAEQVAFATLDEALQDGRRLCKTCRWT